MLKNYLIYVFIITAVITSTLLISCTATDDIYITKVDTVVVKINKTDTVSNPTTLDSERVVGPPFNFNFAVQIGSFDNQTYAQDYADKAKVALNVNVDVLVLDGKYCVCIGSFDNLAKAEAYQKYVQSKGYPEAFIRRK